MHDVKLWKSGESRALRSVLRNHAEGYALLCFHYYGNRSRPQLGYSHARTPYTSLLVYSTVKYNWLEKQHTLQLQEPAAITISTASLGSSPESKFPICKLCGVGYVFSSFNRY